MNKNEIIDDIAEQLGYAYTILKAIKTGTVNISKACDEENEVLLEYCEAYIERCFDSLLSLSENS